jgi:hypothetical protein
MLTHVKIRTLCFVFVFCFSALAGISECKAEKQNTKQNRI